MTETKQESFECVQSQILGGRAARSLGFPLQRQEGSSADGSFGGSGDVVLISQQYLQRVQQSRFRRREDLGQAHKVSGPTSVAQPAPQCLIRHIGPHSMT